MVKRSILIFLVGAALLLAGSVCNSLVKAVNGGMPVPRIATIYDKWVKDGDKDVVGYVSMKSTTRLAFLGDRLGNDSLSWFSLGDILMLCGGGFMLTALFIFGQIYKIGGDGNETAKGLYTNRAYHRNRHIGRLGGGYYSELG